MSDRLIPLSEIADIIGGFAFKSEDFGAAGFPVVKIANIEPPRVNLNDCERIAPENVIDLDKFRLRNRDIVMAMTGATIGKVGRIHSTEPAYLNQRVAKIVAKAGRELDDFIFAVVSQVGFDKRIMNNASGSAQANISTDGIGQVLIPDLSLDEQVQIGKIIAPLDDKIELNRKMNQTLETMAQTIFKSWFVDFDLVRAKADGRDSDLPPDLAEFFPDSFEDSELGEIPKGWSARPLNQVLKEANERVGSATVPEYSSTNEGLQLRSERFTKQLSKSSAKNKLIRNGCLVFGLSRRVLNFGLMQDDIGSVSAAYKVFSVDQTVIRPDLIERMMRVRANYFYNAVSASSREGQSVSSDGLGLLSIVQPSQAVQDAFYRVTGPLLSRAILAKQESLTLSALRDALLPKLLSGEIRVRA